MLKKNNTKKFKFSTKKSVFYHTNSDNSRMASYLYMLTEDLRLGIMPLGRNSKNPEFNITIEPHNSKLENLIIEALPSYFGKASSLVKAVSNFIDYTAHLLAYFGKAYYEIVYYYDNKNDPKPASFSIDNIQNNRLYDVFGFIMQFPPKQSYYREKKNKRFICIARSSILSIDFPKLMGGRKKQISLLSKLVWLSQDTIPKFAMNYMEKPSIQSIYDFEKHRKNRNLYLSKITSHLGWTARNMFGEETLEWYYLYRYLKFEKTKAIIRESILEELNKTLFKIGKKMDFNSKIKITGLYTPESIDKFIKKFIAGELSFDEITNISNI